MIKGRELAVPHSYESKSVCFMFKSPILLFSFYFFLSKRKNTDTFNKLISVPRETGDRVTKSHNKNSFKKKTIFD